MQCADILDSDENECFEGDKEAETKCEKKKRGIKRDGQLLDREQSNAECHDRGECTFEKRVNLAGCENKKCAVCNNVGNCQNEYCEMVNLSDLPGSISICKPRVFLSFFKLSFMKLPREASSPGI